ncbi:MAG: phosphoglucosamine mutase [Clostridia bacterium]|nr:phosphoglucosamine mutase [Clostridia bacterium]
MGLYFGTDGLRGKVNVDLTFDVAYKVGNALSTLKNNPKIVIGADTRISNTYLTLGVASGAMSGGANVIDVGVVPTAGIAYLTKTLGADYGVVISASHNSGEYNGIKVFNGDGYKLGDKEEERIERTFIHNKTNDFPNIGRYEQDFNAIKKYKKFLIAAGTESLKGLKIVLDCAYGASHRIAPEVFRTLGAEVIATCCMDDGLRINKDCGALHPETLAKKVLRYNADMGFAFDGDADRLIAVNDKGEIVNGDVIIYALALYLKKIGKLKNDTVVGTKHTNMAIENALKENGIDLIRTDIGDKYVLAKLVEKNLSIGGEQSGHIILKDIATTGDGILSAIVLAEMLSKEGKKMSEAIKVNLYPQSNKNVIVKDKFRVMNNDELHVKVAEFDEQLKGKGRIMLRASGTEPKVRVMVESQDAEINEKIANVLVSMIEKINDEE